MSQGTIGLATMALRSAALRMGIVVVIVVADGFRDGLYCQAIGFSINDECTVWAWGFLNVYM